MSTDSQTPPVAKSRPFRHWLPHFGATFGVTGSDGSEGPVRQAFGLASRVPRSLVRNLSGVVPGIRDSTFDDNQAAMRWQPALPLSHLALVLLICKVVLVLSGAVLGSGWRDMGTTKLTESTKGDGRG